MRYYLYLIPDDVALKDPVVFAFGDLMQLKVRNIHKMFLVMWIHYMCIMRKKGLLIMCLGIRFAMGMIGKGGNNSAMDVWLEYSIDAPISED